MRRLLREEAGLSLVELLVVCFLTVVLVGAVSNLFVSGLRASATTNSTLASQVSVHTALDRLEFETRCANHATLLTGGSGVALTIPTNCPHATGTVSWCVASGTLQRHTTSDCSGAGQTFATDVTSATPFSCIATVGDHPQLQIALVVNSGTTSTTQIAATDQISMRNAALTTTGSAACS